MSAGEGSETGEEASVVNGLYIFDIEMRDGKRGQARGVVVLWTGVSWAATAISTTPAATRSGTGNGVAT
ncbi:hypothetical protein ACVIWV_003157 [Bradyrhizobium diazoefficiens]